MRERVGRLMYSAGWIGGLADDEWKLLKSRGIMMRARTRLDGTPVQLPHIDPCPRTIIPNLDRALGRAARSDAQYCTVDSWIEDRGFPVDPHVLADRKLFNSILAREFYKKKPLARSTMHVQRGPKPKILSAVMAAMKDDLAKGNLSRVELREMPDKELEAKYYAKRSSVREARTRVLNTKITNSNNCTK
jgi:hypothetical protein